ncbi:MAG: UDP-4-amino-4,6-dideoxy-N-acetyl-beta-L-altrosamine transaminase [Candidatus Micrarchaeota archaeon]
MSEDKFLPYGLHHIDDDDIAAVVEVLKGSWITTGPKVEEFEKSLCDYVGAKHAVAVNSGTSALDIAVDALDTPPGSEIITTPFTFVASSNCILYNQCKPVFADIEPDTYNISPQEVEKKITGKTKAIIYVDYAGQPCRIKELKEIAEKNDLLLIEDAAHAIGAEYKGKRVGSFADITEFSFHPVKHMTTGEGGACTTESDELLDRMQKLRNHGMDRSVKERFGPNAGYAYDIQMLGRNYRITDFQCALGLSQLKKVDRFIARRQEIAKRYGEEFAKMDDVAVPFVSPDVRHAWHLYPLLVPERDRFFAEMRKRGIGVNVHYVPAYKFSYYQSLGIGGHFPVTEDISSREISLPIFPDMTEDDITRVVNAVREILG